MGELSSKKINEIDDIYRSIYSHNNTELDEQQSDVSKQWERGARVVGRVSDRIATPVAGVVKSVADYAGSAISGITKAATGGSVDLEKIGKSAERVLGSGGGKPQSKPPTAKEISTQTPKPTQSQDLGKQLGQWLVPPPEKSADPDVRSGRRTPTGTPTGKPPVARQTPTVKKDPKGAVIVNHFESENDSLVTEAPAQVAPVTGKGGRGWYQKNKAGKYVPITDPEAAKKAKERWDSEQNKRRDPEFRTSGDWVGDPNAGRATPPQPAPRPSPTLRPSPAPAAQPPVARTAPAPRPAPQPKIEKSPAGYALGSVGGVKFERRAATSAELAAAREARDKAKSAGQSTKEQELSAVKAGVSASKNPVKEQKMMNDAYDLVLEYLFSQGHVDTLEEALYVMMQMDGENIKSIVEGGVSFPIEHEKSGTERNKKIRSAADANVPNAEAKYKSTGGGAVMFPLKGV